MPTQYIEVCNCSMLKCGKKHCIYSCMLKFAELFVLFNFCGVFAKCIRCKLLCKREQWGKIDWKKRVGDDQQSELEQKKRGGDQERE